MQVFKQTELPVPAEADALAAAQDAALLKEHPALLDLFAALPVPILFLNEHLQLIHANPAALKIVCAPGEQPSVIGLQPGEVFRCIHAFEPEGCGGSPGCSFCGARRSAERVVAGGEAETREYSLTRADGTAVEFRVTCAPLSINERSFAIMTLIDISHEHRRQILERLFYHDVLNTASSLRGFAELARTAMPAKKEAYFQNIAILTDRLIEEIQSQRSVSAAELGNLRAEYTLVDVQEMLSHLVAIHHQYSTGSSRELVLDTPEPLSHVETDPRLLRRVLDNMVRNAIESTPVGGRISVHGTEQDGHLTVSVHNSGFMPQDIRLQVFKRSFTTKGFGRGLGTYSMKLFTEVYLKGTISFESSPAGGTTFTICIPMRTCP